MDLTMDASELNICLQQGQYDAIEIINLILSSIGLIVILPILIHAWFYLHQQEQIQSLFKALFWISAGFIVLTLITQLLSTIFCVEGQDMLALIFTIIAFDSYFWLLLTLLATLVCRIENTFNGTTYELPKCTRYLWLTMFIITMILSGIATIIFGANAFVTDSNQIRDNVIWTQFDYFGIYIAFGAVLFYVITAIWSCHIFVSRITDLANTSATTMVSIMVQQADLEDIEEEDMNPMHHEEDSIDLNDMLRLKSLDAINERMLNCITRYTSLFAIAIFTSFLTVLCLGFATFWDEYDIRLGQIFMIVSGVDVVINLICVYLQYDFNVGYYERLCKHVENCWKGYFMRKAKRKMAQTKKVNLNKDHHGHQFKPVKTTTDSEESREI